MATVVSQFRDLLVRTGEVISESPEDCHLFVFSLSDACGME